MQAFAQLPPATRLSFLELLPALCSPEELRILRRALDHVDHRVDFIGLLPAELVVHILQRLSLPDLARVACVCKTWRDRLYAMDSLWRTLLRQRLLRPELVTPWTVVGRHNMKHFLDIIPKDPPYSRTECTERKYNVLLSPTRLVSAVNSRLGTKMYFVDLATGKRTPFVVSDISVERATLPVSCFCVSPRGIVVGTNDGRVAAFTRDGTPLWVQQVHPRCVHAVRCCSAVDAGRRIYAVTIHGDMAILGFDTQTIEWSGRVCNPADLFKDMEVCRGPASSDGLPTEDDGEGRTLIEEAWMIDYYPPLKHTMIKSPVHDRVFIVFLNGSATRRWWQLVTTSTDNPTRATELQLEFESQSGLEFMAVLPCSIAARNVMGTFSELLPKVDGIYRLKKLDITDIASGEDGTIAIQKKDDGPWLTVALSGSQPANEALV